MATKSKKSSNKTLWVVVGIVVALIVLFAVYKTWHHYSHLASMQPANSTVSNNGAGQGSGLNSTDTSNQQLDQDVQNIQGSMNQLQKDQTTVNQDTASQSNDIPQ